MARTPDDYADALHALGDEGGGGGGGGGGESDFEALHAEPEPIESPLSPPIASRPAVRLSGKRSTSPKVKIPPATPLAVDDTMTDGPRPSRPASQPSRRPASPRRARVDSGLTAARTTIPTCLVLAVLLPLLAGGWFVLPASSALKAGTITVPVAMFCVGLGCALAAAILMNHVARRLRR